MASRKIDSHDHLLVGRLTPDGKQKPDILDGHLLGGGGFFVGSLWGGGGSGRKPRNAIKTQVSVNEALNLHNRKAT